MDSMVWRRMMTSKVTLIVIQLIIRIYDSRLGRWLSIDPMAKKFPHESPYVAMHNNPITIADPNGDCPECLERMKTVNKSMNDGINAAFKTAMSERKEYGSVIIQKVGATDIKANKLTAGYKGDIYLDFNNIQADYEIAGEFHTHQFTPDEVTSMRTGKNTSFDGNGFGFDSGDLAAIKEKNVKKGYTYIVEAGDTRYGLVIEEPELAKKFLATQKLDASGYSIDAEVDVNLDWDLKKGKTSGNYIELRWNKFKELIGKYEKDTGRKTGIEFFKSKNAEKTEFESATPAPASEPK